MYNLFLIIVLTNKKVLHNLSKLPLKVEIKKKCNEHVILHNLYKILILLTIDIRIMSLILN
jgi:ribose 5-phosphate isomerase